MLLAAPDCITGLILARGPGARMGGADRGLLAFRGLALVAHVVERLARQVAGLMISARRNLERYLSITLCDVIDADGAFTGPLAGIEAGLAYAPTPWIVALPCAAPLLPRTLVATRAGAVNARGVAAASARHDGRLLSVFCLLAVALLAPLRQCRASGGHAARIRREEVGTAAVAFDGVAASGDFDTPETSTDSAR